MTYGCVAQDGRPRDLIDKRDGPFYRSFLSQLPMDEARRLERIAKAPDPTKALLASIGDAR